MRESFVENLVRCLGSTELSVQENALIALMTHCKKNQPMFISFFPKAQSTIVRLLNARKLSKNALIGMLKFVKNAFTAMPDQIYGLTETIQDLRMHQDYEVSELANSILENEEVCESEIEIGWTMEE